MRPPLQAYLLSFLLCGGSLAFPSPYGRSIQRRQAVSSSSSSEGGSSVSSSSSSGGSSSASAFSSSSSVHSYFTQSSSVGSLTTQWQQCDGIEYQGPKQSCDKGCKCTFLNNWYSQCIPVRGWLCSQGANATNATVTTPTYSNHSGTSTSHSGSSPSPSPIRQGSGSSSYGNGGASLPRPSSSSNPSPSGTRCSSSSYSSSSGTSSSQQSSSSGCSSSSFSSNSGLPSGLPSRGATSFLQKMGKGYGASGNNEEDEGGEVVTAIGEGDQTAVASDENLARKRRRMVLERSTVARRSRIVKGRG